MVKPINVLLVGGPLLHVDVFLFREALERLNVPIVVESFNDSLAELPRSGVDVYAVNYQSLGPYISNMNPDQGVMNFLRELKQQDPARQLWLVNDPCSMFGPDMYCWKGEFDRVIDLCPRRPLADLVAEHFGLGPRAA